MSKYVFSVSFCVFLYILSVKCQLEEGADCFSQADNLKGRCVNLKRCLSVLTDIRTKKYPQLCSFSGRDPIICCTDCELVNNTSNYLTGADGAIYLKSGRKAKDKCLEYIANFNYPCYLKIGLRKRVSSDKTCLEYDVVIPFAAVGGTECMEYVASLNYPCPKREGLSRQLEYMDKKCFVYEAVFGAAAVGGQDANRSEFPQMALLGYGDSLDTAQWLCGGSVISERFILTAAHCVFSKSVGTVKYAAMGILKRTDPPETWQRYNVKRAIRHPEYKPPSKYNDIALLEVDRTIKFNKDVLPACLNTGGGNEIEATATGWGTLGHRQSLADILQVVQLEQFSAEECFAAYPPHRHLQNGYNHASQSCYGSKNNKIIDTCEGDSGGPLQITSKFGSCIYDIIGVTSYGRPCGVVGNTGMYTKVEYYVPWIESIVWP
ncbi:unnamed protein product [Arctia plantaginis]|uniref:Peptidase S1 domain-containing protein n=1 Tax=Arctia plantaginis TaxID=874455 RepID=A0A8S1BM93_ARCPL|nr:unnamed protein product [Arctia plantaginis]